MTQRSGTAQRLGKPPRLSQFRGNAEYGAPGITAWADQAWKEIQQLRETLIRCAEIAGEDGEAIEAARSGAMVHPPLTEFAFQAVLRLSLDYAEALDG